MRQSILAVEVSEVSCETAQMKTRLAAHRRRLGLSQEEMAERMDASVSQISRWETGRSNIPSSKMLEIAQAYEIHVTDIFDMDDTAIALTQDALIEMVASAQAEMAAGTTFADWPRAIGSSLWDQLKAIETAGGVRLKRDPDEKTVNVDSLGRIKRK
ncbi:MAG: helix-turn-helix transcriptional regulator [Pseudomonadota bacterium]|nr:helix-turn-helix transcriptional regulator [Pseudomonadota bacterium]